LVVFGFLLLLITLR